ncbi:TonB family protein [Flaviaesturariibacter amylovorans]|uniref:Energy transducer TonB n=1 Tax=Flaviaesturariibacter amylovorans TaxID=1084520 RepID=A0ABP8HA19_9BACT
MTHTDILRASLLDILFERRNKQYGAYTLRKYYPRRLSVALLVTFGSVAAVVLLSAFLRPAEFRNATAFFDDSVVINPVHLPEETIEPPKPIEPQKAQAQTATVHATSRIVFTPNESDVPREQDLALADPGTETRAGLPSDGTAQAPLVGTGTIEGAPAPEKPVEAAAPAGPTMAPSFPGGMPAWMRFLQVNLREPSGLEPGEKRTVRVRFWVGEDGNVSRFEIDQSGGAEYDAEVLRVLKRMGRWNPALQNGRPVATSFVQPVTFLGAQD